VLRSEIIQGINNVIGVLTELKILQIVEGVLRPPDRQKPNHSQILETFRALTLAETKFGKIERMIINTFELGFLEAVEFWINLTDLVKPDRERERPSILDVHRVYSTISAVVDFLPKFTSLLERNVGLSSETQTKVILK
jgi:hypothetical protein